MAQQRPFRFLHASNLHLGKPVGGVADLPAHLRKRLVDAPRCAALRFIDMALAEKVDFVVLSGGVIDCHQTGPWGPVFLVEQFKKLEKAGVAVYWATGKSDFLERWPDELKLPQNVTVFSTSHVDEPLFQKDGFSVARILGISRSPERRRFRHSEFNPDSTGLFTIAVVSGKIDPQSLKNHGIDYWALGGITKRHTTYGNIITSVKTPERQVDLMPVKKVRQEFTRPSTVHYPGAMLARSFEQQGNYGVSLVIVDDKGKAAVSFLPTSPVRFVEEVIRMDSKAGVDQVREELRGRMIAHQGVQDNYDLMMSWKIDGTQDLENRLRRTGILDQFRDELRKDFGMDELYAWTVSVKTAVPENFPPEYYEGETILGDYLQKIRQYQEGHIEIPTLESCLPKSGPTVPMKEQLVRIDPKLRDEFLRQVAELGVDLLVRKEEKK